MIRTGVHAAPAIKSYIGDLYDNCDFFIHTWDYSKNKHWHPDSIYHTTGTEQNLQKHDSKELVYKLNKEYDNKFISCDIENFDYWFSIFGKDYINFSPLWYSWYKSIQLKEKHEQLNNFEYDVVLKLRPDVIYPAHTKLRTEVVHYLLDPSIFYVIGYGPIRIDDVYFLSSSKTMNIAASMIITGPKEWHDNALGIHLAKNNITCKNACNLWYSPLRPESLHIDLAKFNSHFNADRDCYAPYNKGRLSENYDDKDVICKWV
jgi:hypothetical protein